MSANYYGVPFADTVAITLFFLVMTKIKCKLTKIKTDELFDTYVIQKLFTCLIC